ncbi:MAG: bifunctional hydroxymethylpyrimidine kinase/phosphomethylpyrimidine kinase [Nitrospiraceae bacterium]|nr:bifunctional hydroxymethylpyrimidine kinase/phosphomethylpyrimidine kinase [Nitrospiraceae bacterium]
MGPSLGQESPHVLTIAGSDPSGGAGLQQDLKVFTVLGTYGSGVVTALTVQDTLGVHRVESVNPVLVGEQLAAVLEDIRPVAAKTGMLANASIVEVVAENMARRAKDTILVVDPVMVSQSGYPLLAKDAVGVLKTRLFPIADVVTPNIPEAEVLLTRPIETLEEMRRAAADLFRLAKGPSVILKGGHLHTHQELVDVLAYKGGILEIPGPHIHTPHTHGTGCTFSAALTVFLAQRLSLVDAARRAKEFVVQAIRGAVPVGKGIGPTNPLSVLENRLARYPVIEALKARLSSLPCRALVPEVQINLGYALPCSGSPKDVAAFPGRIVALGRGVARIGDPVYGASSHVARTILTVMAYDRAYRSAMDIRYDPVYLERAKKLGYSVAEFSRKDEPDEVKIKEGSTLIWGVKKAIEAIGMVPDIIYDMGDIGKEPIIRVIGHEPIEVVDKALKLAGI